MSGDESHQISRPDEVSRNRSRIVSGTNDAERGISPPPSAFQAIEAKANHLALGAAEETSAVETNLCPDIVARSRAMVNDDRPGGRRRAGRGVRRRWPGGEPQLPRSAFRAASTAEAASDA